LIEELQIRIHGAAHLPTLIYLPGLHGDWTLVGAFRRQLAGKVRFVEFTYPRTLTWSLDDFAAAIETALEQNNISRGWLLGESFGSQIVWPLAERGKFSVQGIILAGGFARHPLRRMARHAEIFFGLVPFGVIVCAMYAFTKFARIMFCRSPERLADMKEFATRRNRLDAAAAAHRLHLISESDPRSIARTTQLPIFYLTGLFDPIVQWPLVLPWFKRNCPTLRDTKIIWLADHNVLGTGTSKAAAQIGLWIQ
jgi:pimeloyl-ACP methyl ester carboxylesterase